jgi:hypothetical protein
MTRPDHRYGAPRRIRCVATPGCRHHRRRRIDRADVHRRRPIGPAEARWLESDLTAARQEAELADGLSVALVLVRIDGRELGDGLVEHVPADVVVSDHGPVAPTGIRPDYGRLAEPCVFRGVGHEQGGVERETPLLKAPPKALASVDHEAITVCRRLAVVSAWTPCPPRVRVAAWRVARLRRTRARPGPGPVGRAASARSLLAGRTGWPR